MSTDTFPEGLTHALKDGVSWLTIDRPRRANSMTLDMQTAMAAWLRRSQEDADVKALVITAIGHVFSAGGDLRELADAEPRALAKRRRDIFLDLLEALLASGKPVVMAVNGKAIGAGAMIGLLGDQVVASDDGLFDLPEVLIDTPAYLASAITLHIAGRAASNSLLLAGKPLLARDAALRGWIAEAVPRDALAARAQEVAVALAAVPHEAFALTKEWMNRPLRAAMREACDESVRVRAMRFIPTARR